MKDKYLLTENASLTSIFFYAFHFDTFLFRHLSDTHENE